MGLSRLFFISLLALSANLGSTDALEFVVTNNALSTLGGQRFDSVVGREYSKEVMARASSFVWGIFGQGPEDRKPVDQVHLFVDIVKGIAFTSGNEIHLGNDYVGNVTGDVRKDVTETLYHEVAHVWQWFGEGAPTGLFEGIADYVVLKAGYGTWAKPGKGIRWDQGYDATALFLDYCSSLRSTFVADLNRLMKDNKYTDTYFVQLLGKTVDQLWADYKAKYGGGESA